MVYFRDYNLIDIIDETLRQAEKGTAREYMEWFSPGVRYEIIINFNSISELLVSNRQCARAESRA